ncbi:MAG: DinB family protein [Chitinophagaceae bacterium]|nr:DinB family protein [Chitinophagaceae bacterium]
MKKLEFLRGEYLQILADLDPNTLPLFGKMNVHQMIEHMSYAFRQASGLIPLDSLNDADTTEKMYRFMMSDKPFRDNTPNPYLPDHPEPTVQKEISLSIEVLKMDIEHFVATFEADQGRRIPNPFFGNLNFEEWIHLLHKHAWHHLRQFGMNIPQN